MRKILLSTIKSALADVTEIMHIAMWNQQVTFVDQEDPFEVPAVFVEFGKLEWGVPTKSKPGQSGYEQTASSYFVCHVVLPATMTDDERLEFMDNFPALLAGISAHYADGSVAVDRVIPSASDTNSDHEELVEYLETFSYRAYRTI